LGLSHLNTVSNEVDRKLVDDLFEIMAETKADFTLTFYILSQLDMAASDKDINIKILFSHDDKLDKWLVNWRERLCKEASQNVGHRVNMQKVNPLYIPRNHLIEAAIRAAEDHDDFSVFHDLHEVLQQPFMKQDNKEKYTRPPEPDEIVWKTFCGT
jgi:protein adenylyltransferase